MSLISKVDQIRLTMMPNVQNSVDQDQIKKQILSQLIIGHLSMNVNYLLSAFPQGHLSFIFTPLSKSLIIQISRRIADCPIDKLVGFTKLPSSLKEKKSKAVSFNEKTQNEGTPIMFDNTVLTEVILLPDFHLRGQMIQALLIP